MIVKTTALTVDTFTIPYTGFATYNGVSYGGGSLTFKRYRDIVEFALNVSSNGSITVTASGSQLILNRSVIPTIYWSSHVFRQSTIDWYSRTPPILSLIINFTTSSTGVVLNYAAGTYSFSGYFFSGHWHYS